MKINHVKGRLTLDPLFIYTVAIEQFNGDADTMYFALKMYSSAKKSRWPYIAIFNTAEDAHRCLKAVMTEKELAEERNGNAMRRM